VFTNIVEPIKFLNLTFKGQPKLDDNEKVVGEHANDEDRIFHWWYG